MKGFLLVTYLTVMLLLETKISVAKPTDGYKQNFYVSRFCDERNETKLYVCQKCAKLTKSADVYPDCCMEKDDVYAFCLRYVHYGVNQDE